MNRLSKKICLITGGGGAIGRATAHAFKTEGAMVILSDGNQPLLDDAAEELGCHSVVQNAADEHNWEMLIAGIEEQHGRLDVLVNNNASDYRRSADGDVSRFQRREDPQLSVVESVILGCRFTIPLMRRTGGGSIINISSYEALNPHAASNGYVVCRTSVGASSGDGQTAITAYIPFGVLGRPCDVAMSAVYLASDESRYVKPLSLRLNHEVGTMTAMLA